MKSFCSPALDVYDLARGQFVRQLTPEGLEGDWWPTGTWSGDRFYLYAANSKGSGQLWTSVSRRRPGLSAGVAVALFDESAGCWVQSVKGIVAPLGNLLIYEEFGWKVDRRNGCEGPRSWGERGSSPATGQLTVKLRPTCIFLRLFPDPVDSGSTACPLKVQTGTFRNGAGPMDPRDGRILQTRHLDPDVWRIAIAVPPDSSNGRRAPEWLNRDESSPHHGLKRLVAGHARQIFDRTSMSNRYYLPRRSQGR